ESDLISATPGWLAYARQFAAARRPTETGGTMSRVYAIESTPTLLGAKADHRLPLRPDELVNALRYVAGSLGAGPHEWAQQNNGRAAWLKALAADLAEHKGRALVHAGREQPAEIHVLADAINGTLGAFGSTVRLTAPILANAGAMRQSVAELAQDMAAGKVDTLLMLGINPVYDAPADLDFAAALRRVPFSVALALYDDETAYASTWRIPATHEYEAWGDARAFDGTVTIQQPQVRPLYGGHSAHQIVALLLGDFVSDDHKRVRDYWQSRAQQENRGDFESFWHEALRVGAVPNTAETPLSLTSVNGAATQVSATKPQQQNGLVALFRPDEGTWDGRYADNPWLLEMARSFTRLTWDNAALVAPATAQRLGLKT